MPKHTEDMWQLTGADIDKSFGIQKCCEGSVISFYIHCLRKDDFALGPPYSGYRVYLHPAISVSEYSVHL